MLHMKTLCVFCVFCVCVLCVFVFCVYVYVYLCGNKEVVRRRDRQNEMHTKASSGTTYHTVCGSAGISLAQTNQSSFDPKPAYHKIWHVSR